MAAQPSGLVSWLFSLLILALVDARQGQSQRAVRLRAAALRSLGDRGGREWLAVADAIDQRFLRLCVGEVDPAARDRVERDGDGFSPARAIDYALEDSTYFAALAPIECASASRPAGFPTAGG